MVYVAPVGGADASNVGLAINAVRHYRDHCQFIYVLEKAGVQLLNLHAELLGDYARREAAAHLNRRDYAALAQTLCQGRLGEPWHSVCAPTPTAEPASISRGLAQSLMQNVNQVKYVSGCPSFARNCSPS